ncbi:MAG: hypothetical protein A2176_00945 [Spirochaetes bacterium RBG_13_51_14]|nr:MAG: hypothetical protein A2176_00945 [Spirochaetes bacterium RBG_13_51_14]
MRLSKSDIIAASAGVTILAVLGYLLYGDLTRKGAGATTEQIGTIATKRNLAERKFSSQVVWNEVFKNSTLYNYDTVRTADQSEAVIRLNDGTVITINENSMILLALSESEVDIKFIQGTINAKQGGGDDASARKVTIQSGESKISLNNSDVSLTQSKDDSLQMTVQRGTATLNTGDIEKVIKENQNILTEKDGIRLYDLTIKLVAPENNRFIATAGDKTEVNFSWERLNGDYSAYLEIANNPAGADPLIKKRAGGAAAAAGLAEGVYYWRVTATNNATKKVESSEIRKISVVNNSPVRLVSPENRSVIKFRDDNPMINFLWSKNEFMSRYTLLVSGSTDMSSPVLNTAVDGNKISINSLDQGTYFWKVVNITETDQINTNAESPVFTFAVSRTEKLEPPTPVSPSDNKSVHPLSIAQKGLGFSWTKNTSIPETQITIAGDREFSRIIVKKNSGENFVRVLEKLNEGNYYWNLRGIMNDGTSTDASVVRSFRIVRGGAIALIQPQNNDIILTGDARKESDVSFSWSQSEIEGRYVLQLSKNRNFNPVLKELNMTDPSAIMAIKEGLHFWRVKLVDDNGTELLASPVYTFEILTGLDPPVAVAPKTGTTVEMLKRETLDFSWNPVPGANLYRIGLYQFRGGIQESIATLETRDSSYKFSELKKLDVGKFQWTLQAFDIDTASNHVRRKSDEKEMIFNITLGIKSDFKFDAPKIIDSE